MTSAGKRATVADRARRAAYWPGISGCAFTTSTAKTRDIGDHFVQRGIERMIREPIPGASLRLSGVNSRGSDETYRLTSAIVALANREADLVIVGSSNRYEGSLRTRRNLTYDDAMALRSLPAVETSVLFLFWRSECVSE